ncbi:MAG: ABC transporter ATP-binding protein [Chloroflexaceae bacterium]|nr:ABC transporter ATP-binding protein [Chloroflexaceae bacterium]
MPALAEHNPNAPRIQTLELRGVTKAFPGVLANDQVSLDVRSGEILALLGENGAGKSTLMKILYGLYQPDVGEILMNGQPVTIRSPQDAINLGIGMIHQHFMLVPELTVAENIALGLKSSRGLLLDLDRVAARVTTLAQTYGLKVDPAARVGSLAVGQQQRVEIIKALYRGADLLVLDEPTAVLTPQEVDDLFRTLKQMRAEGYALIFISHKLHEISDLCDRVTVLRGGRVVGTNPAASMTRADLARLMVGHEVSTGQRRASHIAATSASAEVRLRLSDISATNEHGTPVLQGISFDIRQGEILGVAGVSGNGQRELAEVIAGLHPITTGTILLDGRNVTSATPEARMLAGCSYIPEERMRDGTILPFDVSENLILRDHAYAPYAQGVLLRWRTIASIGQQLVQRFRVKTPTLKTPIQNLSGGNIQKVIMARELSRQPAVLVAAQPTRGVDIGATEYIHQLLLGLREQGAAIVLLSEDLDEVLDLSDRVAVMFAGRIVTIVPRNQIERSQIGLLMAGVPPDSEAT